MACRRALPLALILGILTLPAHADVSVPFARFAELYRGDDVVREPLWNEVRARTDAYRGRTICYQVQVKGRIDSHDDARLIGYTRRDESILIVCPGGCAAGVLGVWVGVMGRLPDNDPNAAQLVATAVTQVAAPRPAGVTSQDATAGAANGAGAMTTDTASSETAAVTQQPVTAAGVEPDKAVKPLPTGALATRGAKQPQAQAPAYGLDSGAVARLERFISSRNSRIDPSERRLIANEVIRLAVYHGMRWEFFASVIAAESDYNKRCVSRAGAMGLGQLMPFNCTSYGVTDPFDIQQNLRGSAQHLREFLDRYRNRDAATQLELTLACYNAGPGAVHKYGGVPPYNETVNYIRKIAGLYLRLCNESAAAAR